MYHFGLAPSSELTCNVSITNASIYLPPVNLLACFRWAMIYRPNTHPFTYTPWYITVSFLLTLTKWRIIFHGYEINGVAIMYMIKLVSLCISIQCWTYVLYFNCEHKFNPLFTESVVVDKTLLMKSKQCIKGYIWTNIPPRQRLSWKRTRNADSVSTSWCHHYNVRSAERLFAMIEIQQNCSKIYCAMAI